MSLICTRRAGRPRQRDQVADAVDVDRLAGLLGVAEHAVVHRARRAPQEIAEGRIVLRPADVARRHGEELLAANTRTAAAPRRSPRESAAFRYRPPTSAAGCARTACGSGPRAGRSCRPAAAAARRAKRSGFIERDGNARARRFAGGTRPMAATSTSSEPQGAAAAGLRYVSATPAPGISRSAAAHRRFATSMPGGQGRCATGRRWRASGRWPSRRPGRGLDLPRATDGHLQATGRDARGRKQYRYHPRWREVRDETKYGRMLAFAKPRCRASGAASAQRPRAARPAAREGAGDRGAAARDHADPRRQRGVRARRTTPSASPRCATRQVRVNGATMRFRFRGKSGVRARVALSDRRLARDRAALRDLPGLRAVPVRRRGRRDRAPSTRPTSTTTCGASPARSSPPRISAPGRAPCSPRGALHALEPPGGQAEAGASDRGGGARSWATPRRSAGSATSTPPSSIRTSMAAWRKA